MMTLFARFKYVLLMLSLGLVIGAASAQSTTVSITAVDQGGQVWGNGTISYVFQPNPAYGGVYFWNNSPLPNQYKTPTILSLNSSGFASFSIPTSVGFITPAGSTWKFVVCPNASAVVCTTVYIPTSGSTQNISSIVTANSPAISLNPTPMPLAYTDTELQTVPNQGGLYFNVTSLLPKYFDGLAWHFFGGGGGTPASPNFFYQLNNGAGSFGTGSLSTDSTFQQLLYNGTNPPVNGATQYLNINFTCIPTLMLSLPPGTVQSSSDCAIIQYSPSFPGWNLGNIPGGAQGVSNPSALQLVTSIKSEGIKTALLINHRCYSIGDCAAIDIAIDARGSCGIDASCEGYGPLRTSTREGLETSGTVLTTGNNLNSIPVTVGGADGVGEAIYSSSYDVLTSAVTSKTGGADSTYGIMVTALNTLPVSLQCSTVAVAPANTGTLPEGTYVARTLTVNTTVDLTSAPGLLASFVSPIIQTSRITSVGTFNAGAQTQTITLPINKNITVGSRYCIGGVAGRGIEQITYTINSQVYLLDAIGSPASNTIWFSSQSTQGPVPPIGAAASNVNIFHKAIIVGITGANLDTFALSDNDIHWITGDVWISPNTINQIRYDVVDLALWNDPYTVDQGHVWIKNGLSTAQSQFLQVTNGQPASKFLGHGGIYPAPLLETINGVVGSGQFWINSPDSCFFSGNPCVPAAISMGTPDPGNAIQNWILASYRGGGDTDQIWYAPSNKGWHITTNILGFLATDNMFQAGNALVFPTHTIEATSASLVTTVGADTPASVFIENRSGVGLEALIFAANDTFNTRTIMGGIALVNASNSHFGPLGDLHFWVNNSGTQSDLYQILHTGIFQNTAASFTVSTSGALKASTVTVSGLTTGQCVQTSTGGLLTVTGSACGGGGGSGTVSAGAQSIIPFYTAAGTGTVVGPSSVQTDSTGTMLGVNIVPTHGLDVLVNSSATVFNSTNAAELEIINSNAGVNTFEAIGFKSTNSAAADVTMGKIGAVNVSVTSTSESGDLYFSARNAGTMTTWFQLLHTGIFQNAGATFTVSSAGGLVAATITDSALTSGQCVQASTAGLLTTTGSACGAGGGSAFSAITNGTNTTAAMVVGTGGSLNFTASGTINASSLQGFVTGTSGGTVPLLNGANTYSGASIFSGAGAASAASVALTGTVFTGGSGTTTFPLFYINLGTGPTTFNTAGTLIGLNAPSAFTGNFIDLHLNGGASIFSIASTGKLVWNQTTTTATDAFNLNNNGASRTLSIGYDGSNTLQINWTSTRAATFTGLATFANSTIFAFMNDGNVTTIASATTITPTTPLVLISGTTTITTINTPNGSAATIGGAFDFVATGVFLITTGGNIASPPITTVTNTPYRCVYMGSTNGSWYCK